MTLQFPFQITIDRQVGSGGAELGQRIAGRLGFAYLDRQILQQAAQELGMSEDQLAGRDERVQNFWVRMMESFSADSPEHLICNPPFRIISDDALIEAEQRVMLRLARRGSCVIVGRCGFHMLADIAPMLNVFVHASRSFRIERMIQHYAAANETIAEEMIDSMDRIRERYVERISGVSWYDARNYHLSIDLSQVGFDAAEAFVISLANRIFREAVPAVS
jgi:cytidylate kinase